MLRVLIGRAFAPIVFLGAIGGALCLASAGASLLVQATVVPVAVIVVLVAERVAPFRREWNEAREDARRDIVHAVVNETLSALSVASIPVAAALHPSALDLWPRDWPLAVQLILAIGVADVGITLVHFASHRSDGLWRSHAVHHSVGRLYGLNGLMKHPLHQAIETVGGTLPLLLVGLPVEVAGLLAIAVAVQLLLQHANLDLRLGSLGRWWAVAPGHRHHHVASATEGDVNFGLFTLAWDRWLGTYRPPETKLRVTRFGIDDRPDYPAGYVAQLIEPFRRRVATTR